jgi:predicted aminopeptidase
VVWNVSGCEATRFEPHIYRYPIVGKLPYIGYFDHADALEEQGRLQELGLDTWVRPAGAYSTLGWFEDPLWRSMLAWDVDQLAGTVLHELAHSTLWLKGHGSFNESFASFVGERSAERFMQSLRETRPQLWQRYQQRGRDRAHSRRSFAALVDELRQLYDSGLEPELVLQRKAQIIAAARQRHRSESWDLDGYAAAMDEGRVLNNARLVQFTVYNSGGEVFAAALERFGGDLPAFLRGCARLEALRRAGGSAWDPYAALAQLGPESQP